jgi:cytochrome c-type biogenesis protein CcmH
VSSRLALLALAALLVGPPRAGAQTPPEVVAADPRQVVGAPLGAPLEGPTLDRNTLATAGLLRCPVCQGLSVADSPSALALKMKAQVRELLAQGYTEEQILAYFERSYGQFVRLEPPLRGINWLVWLAPVLALALGGWVITRVLARGQAPAPGEPAAAPPATPADPALERYLARARALARGKDDSAERIVDKEGGGASPRRPEDDEPDPQA